MTLYDPHARDPLYELEMSRALLEKARREQANPALVQGLENEVKWWRRRAVDDIRGKGKVPA